MLTQLKDKIKNKLPLVGAAVGSGMTAMAAEEGGADLLMVLNAGSFRLQGCGSMAALMPFSHANHLTWSITTNHILPRLKHTPVFVGTCAQSPDLDFHEHFDRIHQHQLAGITNFPSVGFIDGQYREALEEAGLGYHREVELLSAAKKAGLLTIAFCFTPDEARLMAQAGVDILNIDLGFAEWRNRSPEDHQVALDQAIHHIHQILDAIHPVSPQPYPVVYGGPVVLPQDSALVYQCTDVLGYIGGSTVERFPASAWIRQTVEDFRAAATSARTTRSRKNRHSLERLGTMVGASETMHRVFETIRRVAKTNVPILITGESGTGKELAAREIHRLSPRSNRPMVCWNCGAVTESLAMSELFGHEKGAFTGATNRHLGKFEQADGATLFMDEVGELPHSVQTSLLRVLQEGEIVRVGSERTVPVDVRLIAATNRDLKKRIHDNLFRLDLFYRLNTVVIRLPPLRERKDDIPYLVHELSQEFSQRYGIPIPVVPGKVMSALIEHSWPGNIRELRNAIERGFILGSGSPFRLEWLEDLLEDDSIPLHHPAAQPSSNTDRRKSVHDILSRHHGNKAAAARALGVTRKTLYEWLRQESARGPDAAK